MFNISASCHLSMEMTSIPPKNWRKWCFVFESLFSCSSFTDSQWKGINNLKSPSVTSITNTYFWTDLFNSQMYKIKWGIILHIRKESNVPLYSRSVLENWFLSTFVYEHYQSRQRSIHSHLTRTSYGFLCVCAFRSKIDIWPFLVLSSPQKQTGNFLFGIENIRRKFCVITIGIGFLSKFT